MSKKVSAYLASKKAKVCAAAGGLGSALTAGYVSAASQFPTTLAATYTTDVTDTVDDFKLWIIGILFVIAVAMFAVNMTGRGLSKVGGR